LKARRGMMHKFSLTLGNNGFTLRKYEIFQAHRKMSNFSR